MASGVGFVEKRWIPCGHIITAVTTLLDATSFKEASAQPILMAMITQAVAAVSVVVQLY